MARAPADQHSTGSTKNGGVHLEPDGRGDSGPCANDYEVGLTVQTLKEAPASRTAEGLPTQPRSG